MDIVAWVLATYPLGVVLHELGHVVAAFLTGARPYRVTIGEGTPLLNVFVPVLDLRVLVTPVPLTGWVHTRVPLHRHKRLALFLLTLAGPLTSALLAAVAFAFVTDRDDDAMAMGFLLANVIIVGYTAVPFGSRHTNDAALLMQIWRMTPFELRHFGVVSDILEEISRSNGSMDLFGPMRKASELVTLSHELWNPRHAAVLVPLLQSGLEEPGLTRDDRCEVLDGLASYVLFARAEQHLPLALAVTEELMALSPGLATHRGTRGSVLVSCGRIEEGRALLEQCLAASDDPQTRAIALFYLAKCDEHRGDVEAAHERLAAAAALDPATTAFLSQVP